MSRRRTERWFLGAPLGDDGCYEISATEGYDEPSAVVLLFSEWSGVGLRLPKAAGFDPGNRIVHDPDGRPQYDGPSGVMDQARDSAPDHSRAGVARSALAEAGSEPL